MEFQLTEEQVMLRDMARKFAEQEFLPIVKAHVEEGSYDRSEIIKKMASLGLLGFNIPQKYGGLGLDYISWAIIWEQLTEVSWGMANTCNSSILPGTIILMAGSEEQKVKYLPAICNGDKTLAAAAVEPNAGSDAANIQTTAMRSGDYWIINGNKTFCANGGIADAVLVLAQTDKTKGTRGLAVFAVDSSLEGFSSMDIKGKLGYREANLVQLRFDNCRVPGDSLIGEVGRGLRCIMYGVNDARFSIAVSALAIAQGCLDACIRYAKERHQFGRPIGAFQLVQESIAGMAAEIEVIRQYIYYLGDLKNKGLAHRKETSIAKHLASELAVRVSAEAIKIYGAYGCVDDYPVERYYRDAIVTTILGGTTNIHKLIIGRALLDMDATT